MSKHVRNMFVGFLLAVLLALVTFTALEVSNVSSDVDGLDSRVGALEGQGQQAAKSSDRECTLPANRPPKARRPLKKRITLTAEPAVGIVNFGTSRGTKSLYFVIKASRRLPRGLKPKHIELSVPRPPQRISDTLESTSLALPEFSVPRFINSRREIQFQMCIDAAGMEAGTYTNQVFIGGPKGLNGTSVTATMTAKNDIFWLGALLVLAAAAGLLVVMVIQDLKTSNRLIKVTTVLGSLVAAGVAMYTVYTADPSWGADPLTSIFALGGTAFAAAGLGSFITTVFKHGKGKGEEVTAGGK